MSATIGAGRWAAIRALREGEPPTFSLLAMAAGLHPATLRERASVEGWKKQAFQSRIVRSGWAKPAPPDRAGVDDHAPADAAGGQGAARLGDFVARRLAAIVARCEANGGRLDKAEIDALGAMVRTAEKTETLVREPAAETGTIDDAELAARLEKLDERIVELARAHAEWLVGAERRHGVDRQDMGRMAGPGAGGAISP